MEHAVEQHPAGRRVHHALPHAGFVVGPADHEIAAGIGEQIRPFLQPVLIDPLGIVADQFLDAEADREVVHRQSPISAR